MLFMNPSPLKFEIRLQRGQAVGCCRRGDVCASCFLNPFFLLSERSTFNVESTQIIKKYSINPFILELKNTATMETTGL